MDKSSPDAGPDGQSPAAPAGTPASTPESMPEGTPESMPEGTPEDTPESTIDELVQAGRYGEAARLAAARGQAARAADLYERIWEFGLAAEAAAQAGDLARALRNAIDAHDEVRIRDVCQALEQSETGLGTAMQAFAARRRFAEAAQCAEKLGHTDAAIEYYRKAHRDLDAARLMEQAGKDREAGRLIERFIETGPSGSELAHARLRLGLILSRRMNYEAAAHHLQEARRHDETRQEASRALIVALAALGLRDAARDVLMEARAHDQSLPLDVDRLVREARAAERALSPAGDEEREIVIAGRYRVGALIGAGSAGRVCQGHDEVTGRDCAIKLLHMTGGRGNQAFERFVREARLAISLRHPNLVEVYDVSSDQGYLVMELMTGGSLAERIAERPLPGPQARRMSLDVLAGLELAHQRGVIHRDIKPANIFFDARGTAKLGDFGVAHLIDLGQTQTGGLIGTLAYMAPEQITGARLTMAADLYGLGVTLFEALTGRLPFLGPDFVAQHLGDTPPLARALCPDIAPGWDAILARLLCKSPGDRYGSIEELRKDITSLELGEADAPRVLMLHRPGAGPAAEPGPAQARPAAVTAQVSPASPAELEPEPRYQFETAMGQTEVSELGRAVDTVLGRSVMIERYHAGALDEVTLGRLHALARSMGPYLQRALAFDRTGGVAVFEAPAGTPLHEAFAKEPLPLDRAVRLLGRLGRGLVPLHEGRHGHGALSMTTIVVDEDDVPTILCCGLGRAPAHATPEGDVAAIWDIMARITGMTAQRQEARGSPGGEVASPGPAHALMAACLPDMGLARSPALTALSALGSPRSGQELYALADALETAMLRAGRRLQG